MRIRKWYGAVLAAGCLALSLAAGQQTPDPSGRYGLNFDPDKFALKTLTSDGRVIRYRAYEGIVYVSNPVSVGYQTMNFYVPAEYGEGKSVRGYTAETAPVFLPNMVGGYMPGPPGNPGVDRMGRPNAVSQALAKGFVVAAPGARGRTLTDDNGLYIGKAPACIVDLKAAVRYLRYNDAVMPGNAERIISNGTSAGGALSSLLGATGNSADYEPFLKAVGAAAARDDIFAASCYCPITNLDNADAAYEWLFHGVWDYVQFGRKLTMDADQIGLSQKLKALFPAYVNSLGLRSPDGRALTLDKNGEGIFKDYVKSFVIASAQRALREGKGLSGLAWLTVRDGSVTDVDLARFAAYATRMKPAPAFDSPDLNSPENSLFGDATTDKRHFTLFGAENSRDPSAADPAVVRMMNPMTYIGAPGTTTARYWRIRHGLVDRDTSLAVPVILTAKLQKHGADVDFAMPWGQGHGGDYDLEELFAWIDRVCRNSAP